MRIQSTIMFVALVLAAPVALAGNTWQGKVVGVSDGDTITVLRDRKQVRIRLQGIDCPEKRQAFGKRAKQLTSKLVFEKTVRVEEVGKDKYGREDAGRNLYEDWHHEQVVITRCLNEELFKAGLAWHYKRYDKSKRYATLEQKAKEEGRGLWADKSPVPPWEWRRGKRSGGRLKTLKVDPSSLDAQSRAVVDQILNSGSPETKYPAGPFHGNAKSKKFHRPGCKAYDCSNCTAVFKNRKEAVKAGYEPCRKCRP